MATHPRRFSTATSVLLDVLRLASAIMIAFAHVTQSFFSTGRDMTDYGRPALVMLFLLSGLVIRYVTVLRRGKLSDFWIDRISRIYSVVVPALVFTLVASYAAMWINPAYYMPHWGMSTNRPIFRTVVNLVFMAQSWNLTISPFCNDPFWTLSYEVFYYAFYAVGLYVARGRRLFWLLILAVLAGQHILLLLPLWLIGCLGHDVYQRVRNTSIPNLRLNLLFAGAVVVGYFALQYGFRLAIYLKGFVTLFLWAHHHAPPALGWAYLYYAQGIPIMFLLLWAMVLFERLQVAEKAAWVKWVRLFSEATFPLYLLHFPLFVLLTSIFPAIRTSVTLRYGMLAAAVGFSLLLAHPTVAFKNFLRDALRRYLPAAPRESAVAAVQSPSQA